MGAKGEALAKQFEAKVQEATKVIERLSEADWKKTTAAEKWSVGVVAHHIAMAHAGLSGIVKTLAGGSSIPDFSKKKLDDMNAAHARDFAACTKSETLQLHRDNAAAAAAIVRGLGDADLARSGTVMKEMPAVTAEQMVTGGLIKHIDEHVASIRATVGD
jgi:mycothiol maleylpyruvate isomerase-like protein